MRLERPIVALAVTAALAVLACRPPQHTVSPYRQDAALSSALSDRAHDTCVALRGEAPPRPFVTDGCSASPNLAWVHCCVEHDIAYWCGGSAEERRHADRHFEACVEETNPGLSGLMYATVRVGAPSWMPIYWRWGFGWPWPRH